MNWWLLLAAVLLVLLDVAAIVFFRKILRWQDEGAKLLNIGHVPPKVSRTARIASTLFGRVMAFRHVGPVTVLNEEYARHPGRLLIVFNHQIEKDAPMIMYLLGMRNYRYLIASTQVHGARVPLAAWSGAIVVDHKNNPGAAVRVAIKVLNSEEDSSLVVFPQGMLVRNNELKREEFMAGVLMIGKHAHKKSKEPFFVLPAAIDYDRNPAHATFLHKVLRTLGYPWFRKWFGEQTYGAAVAFGKPIPMDDLPADLNKGMDIVFARIQELSAQAKAVNENGGKIPAAAPSEATA